MTYIPDRGDDVGIKFTPQIVVVSGKWINNPAHSKLKEETTCESQNMDMLEFSRAKWRYN